MTTAAAGPRRTRGRRRLALAALLVGLTGLPARPAAANAEDTPGAGHDELIATQTLHGMAIGGELTTLTHSDKAPMLVVLGGGLALGTTMAAGGRATVGQTRLATSGVFLGGLSGLATGEIAFGENSGAATAAMIAGQLGGVAGGLVLGHFWQPRGNQVALGNTVALWSALVVHQTRRAAGRNDDSTLAMVLAADAGFALGASLWPGWQLSRAQAWQLDLGGALGGLAGVIIGAVVDHGGDDRPFHASAAIGMALGLGVAAWWLEPDGATAAPGRR